MTDPGIPQVCLTVSQGTWSNMRAVAQAVDEVGLHSVDVPDTPMVERDVYLSCAAAALETSPAPGSRPPQSAIGYRPQHPSLRERAAPSRARRRGFVR